jgi:hypothetical protein
MRVARATAVTLGLLLALGCGNAGESRLLTVSASGVVKGLVYFDLDGNGALSFGDDSVKGMRVSLLTKSLGDTVATAVSAVSGQFRMTGVPVGTYRVSVDAGILSDTAVIAKVDSAEITVVPGDSTAFLVGAGYPHVSVSAARTTALLGRRVFVEGIVLNTPGTFRDTTMHVQDTSGAIRTTRVHLTSAQAADSVRVRGTTSRRAGQRTLDDITVFGLRSSFLPSATTATTAQAASANNGARDAQQLQVLGATVTDTASVAGDFQLMVSDGSGALEVLLDGTADPAFRPPFLPGVYIPGNKFDIVGLAVPTGAPGVWRLKPRSSVELIKR